jgi:hypothetical protein
MLTVTLLWHEKLPQVEKGTHHLQPNCLDFFLTTKMQCTAKHSLLIRWLVAAVTWCSCSELSISDYLCMVKCSLHLIGQYLDEGVRPSLSAARRLPTYRAGETETCHAAMALEESCKNAVRVFACIASRKSCSMTSLCFITFEAWHELNNGHSCQKKKMLQLRVLHLMNDRLWRTNTLLNTVLKCPPPPL